MQLNHINETLEFLQECYEVYRGQTPEERALVEKTNAFVHQCVQQHRKDMVFPLRTLYIHQLMHNQQLKGTLPDDVREMLLGSKFMLSNFIREQIQMGERIVPDAAVESTAKQCREQPELLLSALGQWIDESKRPMFLAKLQHETAKFRGREEWLMKVLNSCIRYHLQLTEKTLDAFTRFFCMIECIRLCEPAA
jgi:hypothetical protein